MRRGLTVAAAALLGMVAAVTMSTAASASTPPTGGGPYDHRGYEVKASSASQPYCLSTFTSNSGVSTPTMTGACNYYLDEQQWWANRHGQWSNIENYANGRCLVVDPNSNLVSFYGLPCTSYFAQWSRDTSSRFVNRGTGECLAGRAVTGESSLTVMPCTSTYIERWLATG